MSTVKVTLQRVGKEIRRQFDPSLLNSEFGKALKALDKTRLANAFPEIEEAYIHSLDPHNEVFLTYQDVPWYLDAIGRQLFGDRTKQYELHVKSCAGFLFIRLYEESPTGQKLSLRPFFHDVHLPDRREADKVSKRERLRGFADTLLFIAPELKHVLDSNPSANIRDLFDWSDIRITARCANPAVSTDDTLDLEFTPITRVFPLEVDEWKKSFEIKDAKAKPLKVLVASSNVRVAIKDLAEVWHNEDTRSVLLSAWTGSGKEILKELYVYSCRLGESEVVDFSAPELGATSSPADLIYEELTKRGLVDKDEVCKRSVLFLDEIHQTGLEQFRSRLLRAMETSALAHNGSRTGTKKLTYLFAASQSPDQLRALPPLDFWTRIEYNVVMRHPLMLDSRAERDTTLQHYFCMFWRKTASDRKNECAGVMDNLISELAMGELSKKFADELGSPLIPLISMRMIRSLVARLFGRAFYVAQTSQFASDTIVGHVAAQFDDWITEICRQIVPDLKPNGVF